MKIKYILDPKQIFHNLKFEIYSRDQMTKYKLSTILPPDEICFQIINGAKTEHWIEDEIKNKSTKSLLDCLNIKWKKINDSFFKKINNIIHIQSLSEYNIYCTFYGPGGSYEMPNKVFLRVATKEDIDYSDVNTAHEIIHLMVEKTVQKHKLNHDDKELLVNSILFQPQIASIFGIKNEAIASSKFFHKLNEFF